MLEIQTYVSLSFLTYNFVLELKCQYVVRKDNLKKLIIVNEMTNLTHEFLYEKNSCVKIDALSRTNGSFFSEKRGAKNRKF